MRSSRLKKLALALVVPLLLGALACRPSSVDKAPPPAKRSASAKKQPKATPPPKDPWLDEIVAAAEVSVTAADGKTTPCAWDAKRRQHRCEGYPNWLHVGAKAFKVGTGRAFCVWQHPLSGGTVTTTLKGVATEPLEFGHAFTGNAAKLKEGAPVDVVVLIDGEERAALSRSREPGFEKARLSPAAEGKAGDVTIRVSTKEDGAAHYCWRLKRAAPPEVKRASIEEPAAPANTAKVKPAAAEPATPPGG